MPSVEKIRGYIAAVVAALAVIGGALLAVVVWTNATETTPPREFALILGLLSGIISSGSTFLFMSDAGSGASHAAERSFSSGQAAGAALPEQFGLESPVIPAPPPPVG